MHFALRWLDWALLSERGEVDDDAYDALSL